VRHLIWTWACAIALVGCLSTSGQALEWTTSPTKNLNAPKEGPRAKNGLPDGRVAVATTGDIVRAWYILPTGRYRHGILGDAVEAGGIALRDRNGETIRLTLPKSLVFEDRTPRLHDLDGDGKNELITIQSSLDRGASVAVYGLFGGRIKLLSRTPFIGRSNRWRNIAGIADYNGDGHTNIAEVVTPHIGGTLNYWTWKDGNLSLLASAAHFSNHAIGSREQRLSATADFNGNGRLDIAVPDSNRRVLRLIGFTGKSNNAAIADIARIRLPAAISHPVVVRHDKGQAILTVGLTDGSILDIRAR
jgi:hypothetical protein